MILNFLLVSAWIYVVICSAGIVLITWWAIRAGEPCDYLTWEMLVYVICLVFLYEQHVGGLL